MSELANTQRLFVRGGLGRRGIGVNLTLVVHTKGLIIISKTPSSGERSKQREMFEWNSDLESFTG